MFLFWILVVVGLGALVAWLVRSGRGGSLGVGPSRGRPSPLDILKIRYAKGEITREEFQRLKKDLAD